MTFPANRLERLVIQPQSLRSLKRLWDSDGVCSGAPIPSWPICVGYDRTRRQEALTVRIRKPNGGPILYESAVYWHMQDGAEHDEYLSTLAAWQTAVTNGTHPFGTALNLTSNSTITYALGPIAALADKVGFDGNQILHISTESDAEAASMRYAPGGSGSSAGSNSSTNSGGAGNSALSGPNGQGGPSDR